MTVRETLLATYREKLAEIARSERVIEQADEYEHDALTTYHNAQSTACVRRNAERDRIASSRAEIVACRVGLGMAKPKTGTELPPELGEDGTDTHGTAPQPGDE